jgi:hypothetical protein
VTEGKLDCHKAIQQCDAELMKGNDNRGSAVNMQIQIFFKTKDQYFAG